MEKRGWIFQDTDDDCWICSLINALRVLDWEIDKNEVLEILKRKGYSLFGGRAFFPYIGVILEEMRIKSTFVINDSNPLTSEIIDCYQKNISVYKINQLIHEMDSSGEIGSEYYVSLREIATSSYVNVLLETPSVKRYLNKGAVVIAGVFVSDLYESDLDRTLHIVTIFRENNEYKIIDPYYRLGKINEENWDIMKLKMEKLEWLEKIQYFIAIEKQ